MTKHKALLALLVVGVLFIGATTAQAYYCEKWGFNWGGGSIYWNSTWYDFDNSFGDSGHMWCVEDGHNADDCPRTEDCFLNLDWTATFVARDSSDTLFLRDSSYNSYYNDGCKETGQSGTKEATSGNWCGWDSNNQVFIHGTWDTGDDNDQNYFNYTATPAWNGEWHVKGASWGVTGASGGTVGGMRIQNYDPCCL